MHCGFLNQSHLHPKAIHTAMATPIYHHQSCEEYQNLVTSIHNITWLFPIVPPFVFSLPITNQLANLLSLAPSNHISPCPPLSSFTCDLHITQHQLGIHNYGCSDKGHSHNMHGSSYTSSLTFLCQSAFLEDVGSVSEHRGNEC